MKTGRAVFKNAFKFCRRNELRIKITILLSKFEQKKSKEFWKEVKKFKGNTTVIRCIGSTSILQDTVKNFDRKFKEVLDNSERRTHSVGPDPMLRGTYFSFTPKDLDVALDRLNPGTGFDGVHTDQIKNAKRCYRNLICKFYNKLISRTYIPHSMLKEHIRPNVKNSAGNKNVSKNDRPVMNSSNFLKVIEYLLQPHLEKHLPTHENQFAYRPATGCIDGMTVLKETVMYYNSQRSDVYCAMLDLSKAYDKINTSLLCDKTRETNY